MKKIILCLLVFISCTDNTSVESQNLKQLLKPNFEYRFVEMQCQFRSSNNLASLERLIPRIKEVLPEEISMTVAFRFINDQVDTKSFFIWLEKNIHYYLFIFSEGRRSVVPISQCFVLVAQTLTAPQTSFSVWCTMRAWPTAWPQGTVRAAKYSFDGGIPGDSGKQKAFVKLFENGARQGRT